jgi:hypothetical protein
MGYEFLYSWSKPYRSPLSRRLTRNDGERKFSMSQNLTVLFVFLITLSIMIEDSRCVRLSLYIVLAEGVPAYLVQMSRSNGEDIDVGLLRYAWKNFFFSFMFHLFFLGTP